MKAETKRKIQRDAISLSDHPIVSGWVTVLQLVMDLPEAEAETLIRRAILASAEVVLARERGLDPDGLLSKAETMDQALRIFGEDVEAEIDEIKSQLSRLDDDGKAN